MKKTEVYPPATNLTDEQHQSLQRGLSNLGLALQITDRRHEFREDGPMGEEVENAMDAVTSFLVRDAIHEIGCALDKAA